MIVRTLKRHRLGERMGSQSNIENVDDEELHYEDYLEEELDRGLKDFRPDGRKR